MLEMELRLSLFSVSFPPSSFFSSRFSFSHHISRRGARYGRTVASKEDASSRDYLWI